MSSSQASSTTKLAVAVTLTMFTCSQGILMEASKVGGKYSYNVATVPLLAEFTKFLVSGIFLYRSRRADARGTQMTVTWQSVRLFPIPSIIYLVHNNVQFYTMSYVDAATYQILGNLKIVTTGLLFWLFLGRRLSKNQWLALVLLTAAATTSQISTSGSVLAAPIMGYIYGVLSACLSAIAGVYTEFLLKKNQDNLQWQNVQLYGFGTVFNALRLTYDDVRGGTGAWWPSDGLQGYNFTTYLIVLNFAFAGMMVSWIQKYADTIVKVYATSSAMFVTAAISICFMGLQPSLQLFLGVIVASISLSLYFFPNDWTYGSTSFSSGRMRDADSTKA